MDDSGSLIRKMSSSFTPRASASNRAKRIEQSIFASSILDVETERLAKSRRDRETAEVRRLITAVGVERWGQRAGQLAELLNKHPVAVSRWVTDAARRRQEVPAFGEEMDNLDEALSAWALDSYKRGELAPGLDENPE